MGKDVFINFEVLKNIEIIVHKHLERVFCNKLYKYDNIEVKAQNLNGHGTGYTSTPNIHVNMDIFVDGSRKDIGSFMLEEMPGCCGYLVSKHTAVMSRFRNMGISTVLQKAKVEIAKLLDFSVLICTTTKKNTTQNKILKRAGWKKLDKSKNGKTGNTVFLWRKKVA